MDLDEKIEFVQSTLAPMAQHTYPYISSVLGIARDGSSGVHVGSGLRALIDGQRCLITAEHVIEKARERYHRFAVTAIRGAPPYELHRPPDRVHETYDLAIYFLPDDYPDEGISFWPQYRMDIALDKLSTDYLFVHGFPRVRSHFDAQRAGLFNASLPYGAMRREDDLPDDITPFQFAMDFNPSNLREPDGSPAAWIDPLGLSGSPVFRIGASGQSADDWRVDCSLLVGIVTQWRPTEQILIATKCEHILEILRPS